MLISPYFELALIFLISFRIQFRHHSIVSEHLNLNYSCNPYKPHWLKSVKHCFTKLYILWSYTHFVIFEKHFRALHSCHLKFNKFRLVIFSDEVGNCLTRVFVSCPYKILGPRVVEWSNALVRIPPGKKKTAWVRYRLPNHTIFKLDKSYLGKKLILLYRWVINNFRNWFKKDRTVNEQIKWFKFIV